MAAPLFNAITDRKFGVKKTSNAASCSSEREFVCPFNLVYLAACFDRKFIGQTRPAVSVDG